MSKRDTRVVVKVARDIAGRALERLEKMSQQQLRNEQNVAQGLSFLIMKTAAIVEKLPHDFRSAHAGAAWDEIITRGKFALERHEEVTPDFVWETIRGFYPAMIESINEFLDSAAPLRLSQ